MASYDTTIRKLARDKARMSPDKRIAEQSSINADLRILTKKNKETKNFVEYKASQIVRSQDRIR